MVLTPLAVVAVLTPGLPLGRSASGEPVVTSTVLDARLERFRLNGLGSHFVAEGTRFGVDPRLAVAIAGAESTFGNRVCTEFNAWNWFWEGPCPKSPFESWKAGATTVTKFMKKSYLLKGYTTIALIGSKYCAAGCEHWEPNVRSVYTELGGRLDNLAYDHPELAAAPPATTPESPPRTGTVPPEKAAPSSPPSPSEPEPDRSRTTKTYALVGGLLALAGAAGVGLALFAARRGRRVAAGAAVIPRVDTAAVDSSPLPTGHSAVPVAGEARPATAPASSTATAVVAAPSVIDPRAGAAPGDPAVRRPAIGDPTATPCVLGAGIPATVTVSARVMAESPATISVSLLRVDPSGAPLAVLGVMRESAGEGPPIAGARTYAIETRVQESSPGLIRLQVLANVSRDPHGDAERIALASRVCAIAVTAGDLLLTCPAGWHLASRQPAEGNAVRFQNADWQPPDACIPPGHAEIEVRTAPRPSAAVADVIARDLAGFTVQSTLDTLVGTRVVYVSSPAPEVSYRNTALYMLRGSALHTFTLRHRASDPGETAFAASFQDLLNTARFGAPERAPVG